MDNKDLETCIIMYFLQNKQSTDYLEYGIDSSIFKEVIYGDIFTIFKSYVEIYKGIPDINGMCALLKESGATEDQVVYYRKALEPLYSSSMSDPIAEDYMIKEVK